MTGGVYMKRTLARLPRRWNRAQLLHQTEVIRKVPPFGNLAISDAVLVHPFHRYLPACRGNADKLTLVRAAPVYPGHHLVSLGHHVLNCDVKIREGRSEEHTSELQS